MWELDYKESWAPKNGCFWSMVLEKTLESPLDCKEIQPAHPKGNQSWIFTGKTDAETETPILRPPGVKNWLIGKDPDAGKDWRQEEKRMTEDEMIGWHHQLDGPEFQQALGVGGKQGSLAYCSPRGHKEVIHDWATDLNWTESNDVRTSREKAEQDMNFVIGFPEMTSLVSLMVKYLPTMWETQVQSLGWEDLLEKEMATYSSTLVWKIPWIEEPGRLHSHKESDTTERFHFPWNESLFLPCKKAGFRICHQWWKWSEGVSHSVMSNSFRPHGLCPWNSPDKNTGVLTQR